MYEKVKILYFLYVNSSSTFHFGGSFKGLGNFEDFRSP